MSAPAHTVPQPAFDPVVAAMLAAGWSDAAIGAALRAAHDFNGQKADSDDLKVANLSAFGETRPKGGQGADHGAEGGGTSNVPGKFSARQALQMLPGLTPSARLVGAQIVDHFNRNTGRCDPSNARLARLCGISERSVRRAVAHLVGLDLLVCRRHGGRSLTNAYQPNWQALAQKVASLSPAGQNPDGFGSSGSRTAKAQATFAGNPDTIVRKPGQQSPPNPEKEPYKLNTEFGMTTGSLSGKVDQTIPVRPATRQNTSGGRGKAPDRRQRSLLLPMAGGNSTPASKDVARDKAQERLWKAGQARFAGSPSFALFTEQSMNRADEWEKAIEAEQHKPGSGLRVFLDAVQLPKRTGTGGVQAVLRASANGTDPP